MTLPTYIFGNDSDIFVSQNSKGEFICQFCSLVHEEFYKAMTADEMITHLEEHINDGDNIPGSLIADLKIMNLHHKRKMNINKEEIDAS